MPRHLKVQVYILHRSPLASYITEYILNINKVAMHCCLFHFCYLYLLFWVNIKSQIQWVPVSIATKTKHVTWEKHTNFDPISIKHHGIFVIFYSWVPCKHWRRVLNKTSLTRNLHQRGKMLTNDSGWNTRKNNTLGLWKGLKILNISSVCYFLRISAEKEQYTTSNHRGKGSTWLILIPTHKSNQIIILISGQDGRDAGSCEQFAGESERKKPRAVIR